ncbi:hypothetical protein BCV69DRAFT_250376, partial [Microstroma glucosiphilum]
LDQAPLSTSCAAALLYNLSRITSVAEPETNAGGHLGEGTLQGIKLTSLETLHLNECMTMTAESREALAIMTEGAQKGWGRARKDSTMTIYTMLDNLRTPISHTLLNRWFLFPSMSLTILSARHQAVECLASSASSAVANALVSHLKGIKNIPRLVNTLQRGGTQLSMWKGLFAFCVKTLHIRACMAELDSAEDVPIVRKILAEFDTSQLQSIAESLDATIDWDQSAAERRFIVKAQIDPQLDKWRELYAGLPSLLLNIAQSLKASLDFEHSGQMNVAYFPQLGYLIALPFNQEVTTPEDMNVPADWTFHFASEISTYWKSPQMYDLDEHVGDVHSFIADREVELIHDLSVSIAEQGGMLIHIAEICAELDVLLSFAQAANIYGWIRPTMTDTGILDIKGGRHPLQELTVENFQPNDTLLYSGCGVGSDDSVEGQAPRRSVEILTGANGCGKSVYLKQVALIVFLSQIGSFVPAQSATIGVVDQILTRVQTRDSASRMQSSFMADLGQVSHALRNCTSRSLILLDEFGKGTLSNDGAALFSATIRHLLKQGTDCPRVLATTHFHDVFKRGCLPPELPYKASHMQIFLDESHLDAAQGSPSRPSTATSSMMPYALPTQDIKDSITFLYRVAPGHAQESHAAFCARACGIPRDVVERAQYVTHLAEEGELDTKEVPEDAMTVRRAQELQRKMRRFIEWDIEEDIRVWEQWEEAGGKGSPPLDVRGKLERISEGK